MYSGIEDLGNDKRIVTVTKLGDRGNWSDSITIPKDLSEKYGFRASSYNKKVYAIIEERESEKCLIIKTVF